MRAFHGLSSNYAGFLLGFYPLQLVQKISRSRNFLKKKFPYPGISSKIFPETLDCLKKIPRNPPPALQKTKSIIQLFFSSHFFSSLLLDFLLLLSFLSSSSLSSFFFSEPSSASDSSRDSFQFLSPAGS